MIWMIFFSIIYAIQLGMTLDLILLEVIKTKREVKKAIIPFYWIYAWLKKAYNTYKNLP